MSETAVAQRPKRHPHRKDYTEQEIDAALRAYVICSGHRDRASKLLSEEGMEISPKTLYYWANTSRVEQYERLRQEIAPRIQAQMADTHQALAQSAADIEAQAVGRLRERLNSGDMEDRDLINLHKNAAIAGAVHVDKAQLLNDRPTQIIQRDASEVLRALKAKGVPIAEVIDAEVVEDDPVGEIES